VTLYIFDKDGTVLFPRRRVGLLVRPILKCEDQVVKPGVFEKLAELRAAGHRLALASNQEAVASGAISLAQSEALMKNCAAKLGGVDAWRLSPYDPRAPKRIHGHSNRYAQDDPSRKPHPGMLLDLMTTLGVGAADTVVVGNSSKDRDAAHAAGVRYISCRKFFKN
jgi:D-glycero-D-manno-heptose 1,7-bisphosphate phosphatase